MSLGLLLLLLVAPAPRMAFWGGSVAIPEGCSGPATVRTNVDWFTGTILCREAGLSINVAGGMVEPACSSGKGPKPHALRLATVGGEDVILCSVSPAADSSKVETHLAADVGLAILTSVHVTAEVRSALGARLFLEVVSSYRPNKARQ